MELSRHVPATSRIRRRDAGRAGERADRGCAAAPVGLRAIVSAVRVHAATAVERALARVDPELPGAMGPAPEVESFAAAHVARSGAAVRVDLRLRLFALDRLTPPTDVAGAARTASARDTDLIDGWMEEFMAEAIPRHHNLGRPAKQAVPAAEPGHRRLIWEVDGEPVALAVARAPAAGTSRIGPVYTPLRHRGHGYAAGVTTAAAR